MTSDSGGVSGSDDAGVSARIGTVERDQAIAVLAEHWQAGRLDPGEHEHRVTRAKAAVIRADLDTLFADLPPAGVTQVPAPDMTGVGSGHGANPVARGFLEGNRDTVVALMPFLALVLFFTTGSWLWFLMIPVLGIVLYGPGGKKHPRQRRR